MRTPKTPVPVKMAEFQTDPLPYAADTAGRHRHAEAELSLDPPIPATADGVIALAFESFIKNLFGMSAS